MFEGMKNFFSSPPDKKISGKKVETISSTTRKSQEKPSYKNTVGYDENLDKGGVIIDWGKNTDNSNSGTKEAYKVILDEQMKGTNFQNRPDAIPFKKADPNFVGMSGDTKTYEINPDEIDLKKTRDKIDKMRPAA